MTEPRKDFETLYREMLTYSVDLTRAIEAHCRGEVIGPNLKARCPHHAQMLNTRLIAVKSLENLKSRTDAFVNRWPLDLT